MGRPRLMFLGFVLDPDQCCLFSENGRVSLSPKDCALLYHLAANAGRVVSHADLLRAGWGATSVGPDVLKVRIARIRRLLGDNVDAPRFIANVHGEGYRFVPPRDRLLDVQDEASSSQAVVGREQELGTLASVLSAATAGVRQMLFVTGEAGIGKTAVIDEFIRRTGARARIGRGQCIEFHGSGEPYLPVMEALTDLGRHDESGQFARLLERYAPSWLIQLPGLLDVDQRQHIGRRVLEPSRERMLRELAEALEAHDQSAQDGHLPLVLVLEDIHWADVSTLDLLQMLARRRERARLLVLSTYRSLGPVPSGDPLRRIVQDLHIRGFARELPLGRLREADVARFLDQQFPGHTFERQLVTLVHRKTAGHPLFLSELVRELQVRGVIKRVDGQWAITGGPAAVSDVRPSSVSEFLARVRETFSVDDRRLLEAASIAGLEFSTADLAAALCSEPAVIEEQCLRLANGRRYLQVLASEQWPDGTQSMRFGFPHALHQELWQTDVGHSRAEEWHLRIAERREGAYGVRAPEIAPALAAHFEHGRDYRRAVLYCEHAGRLALQRAATVEAKEHLRHALRLLAKLPDSDDRQQLELRLQIGVGNASALAEGFGSEDAVAASRRAYDICRESDAPRLFDAIYGLCRFFWAKGELIPARELGEKMQAMATSSSDPIRMMAAQAAHGSVLAMRGETTTAASVLRDGLSLSKLHWRDDLIGVYGGDLEIVCAGTLVVVLQVAGHADEALQVLEDSLLVADRRHPVAKVGILYSAAFFHQVRNDHERALSCALALRHAAASHQLSHYALFAEVFCGWGFVATGQVEEGTAALTNLAETLRRSRYALLLSQVLLLLAQAYQSCGKLSEARQTLHEAFTEATNSGGTLFDAEMHRLNGELTCQTDADGLETAEAAFHRALAVSREQGAKLWELRAALSLAQLWRRNGRGPEAHTLVSDTYRLFSEGFDTPDLTAARTFLS